MGKRAATIAARRRIVTRALVSVLLDRSRSTVAEAVSELTSQLSTTDLYRAAQLARAPKRPLGAARARRRADALLAFVESVVPVPTVRPKMVRREVAS